MVSDIDNLSAVSRSREKIRLATAADAAEVHAIYARIAATLATHPWLVLERDGAVAGYAYASPHRERLAYQWAADVSSYVHPDFQRRGIGRALYLALFRVLRAQGLCNA